MSVHNQISRGELTVAATRALGVTKVEGGVERFSETVDLVMNLWGMPEWAYLRGEQLGVLEESVALVAGEFGVCSLINPAGSGLIVVVESAVARGTTWQLFLGTEATISAGLAGAGTPIPRDTRYRVATNLLRPLRTRSLTGTNPASLGAPIDRQSTGVPSIVMPIILAPGWGLACELTVVATLMDGCVFTWRERQAFPGELV